MPVGERAKEPVPDRVERAANAVIGAAIEVHRSLGPGYGESVYEKALAHELKLRGIPFARQSDFELTYKGETVGAGRLDFLVDGCLIVELKAVEAIGLLHIAQAISYLRATELRLALIINFNVPVLTQGIRRVVL